VALRAQLIGQNPTHDLVGAVTLKKSVRRPALPLNRLPELLERIEAYKGRELTCLAMKLSLHVFVRSSELRFARWSEFDLDRAFWEIPDTRKAIKGVRFNARHQNARRRSPRTAVRPSPGIAGAHPRAYRPL
jgi:integrase